MAKSPETVSLDQLDKDQMKTVNNAAHLIDKSTTNVMQCAIECAARMWLLLAIKLNNVHIVFRFPNVLQQTIRNVLYGLCTRFHITRCQRLWGKRQTPNWTLAKGYIIMVFLDLQEKCSLNCMEKYLKMNQRVSQRFQEFQMIANENALAMAQKTNKL